MPFLALLTRQRKSSQVISFPSNSGSISKLIPILLKKFCRSTKEDFHHFPALAAMKELGKIILKMITSLNENEEEIVEETMSQLGMIYEEEPDIDS
jgi:hypothetical protein